MEIIIHEKLEEFIDGLPEAAKARLIHTIDLLETLGNKIGMPHSKKVTNKLFELRILGTSNIRIFYAYQNSKAHLVHGFIKKSQKTPKNEIDTALKRL